MRDQTATIKMFSDISDDGRDEYEPLGPEATPQAAGIEDFNLMSKIS